VTFSWVCWGLPYGGLLRTCEGSSRSSESSCGCSSMLGATASSCPWASSSGCLPRPGRTSLTCARLGPPSSRELSCPSAVLHTLRPLPSDSEEPDFGSDGTTRLCSFRPHGLSPPRRLSPQRAPGSLHPEPALGFVAFLRRSCAPKSSCCTRPRDAHTPRRRPLISSRSASLRLVPSCRFCPPKRTRDFRALLH
jgi:hypothetical protein